jgi:N6-L-threonylcarbamoyladenine synthase
MDRPGCDMSFSGLKTALRRHADALAEAQGGLTDRDRADLCAAFQQAVAGTLVEKTARALAAEPGMRALAAAGGVAANRAVRAGLARAAAAAGVPMVAPPGRLCTDNAAMIAWAGAERFARGEASGLDLPARPRWPLDEDAAALIGGGRKGPKA